MSAPSADVPRRALVLAAGMGRRLRPLTESVPKALVEVHGTPILVNTLRRLQAVGVQEVVIVVGHRASDIRARIGARHGRLAVRYVEVDDWATANNIRSVWAARAWLDQDLFLVEGDVFLGEGLLERLVAERRGGSVAAVAHYGPDNPGSALRLGPEGTVHAWAPRAGPGPSWTKTVNVYLLDRGFLAEFFLPAVQRRIEAGRVQDFYEAVLEDLDPDPVRLRAVRCDDLRWQEIDDVADLASAEDSFPPGTALYDRVLGSHGGWWRHPFADHAYLVNPYFPPDALLAHLGRHLGDLVSAYPMGQRPLATLMARVSGEPADRLVVANGASELITKILPRRGLALPVPSFNEWEARTPPERVHPFLLGPPDFDLDIDAFAEHALAAGCDLAVVVSPNNPTSRAVPRADLLRLAERLAAGGCRLVVDESFVDFHPDGRAASVQDALFGRPGLAVLRSIGKVYGAGGLRLGYLATDDPEWVATVRAALPVWNVNGFAEEFLRVLPAYRAALEESCARVRADRDVLYRALCAVPGLRPVLPHANFVLCRLPDDAPPAPVVARTLFDAHGCLVKDCSNKAMPDADRYLRIGARTEPENAALVAALSAVLRPGRALSRSAGPG